MATDPRKDSSKAGAAPIKDAPLSHPGSGGAGDDRQDNSAGDPSASWAPDSENAGRDKSESDPE